MCHCFVFFYFRTARTRCFWRACCSPVWSGGVLAHCRGYWKNLTLAWNHAAATSSPPVSSCRGGDTTTLSTSFSSSWWLECYYDFHLYSQMPEKVSQKSTKYFSLTCRMLFTWTGSCARGHDLHPILHTWSQFVPAAGRSAGISPVFPPTVMQL